LMKKGICVTCCREKQKIDSHNEDMGKTTPPTHRKPLEPKSHRSWPPLSGYHVRCVA